MHYWLLITFFFWNGNRSEITEPLDAVHGNPFTAIAQSKRDLTGIDVIARQISMCHSQEPKPATTESVITNSTIN